MLAVVAGLLLPTAPKAQNLGQRLSEAEIPIQVFGRTWLSKPSEGGTFLLVIAVDGSATQTFNWKGKEITRPGKVFVRTGKLCRFWENSDNGRETCYDAFLNGNNIVMVGPSGQVASVWHLQK